MSANLIHSHVCGAPKFGWSEFLLFKGVRGRRTGSVVRQDVSARESHQRRWSYTSERREWIGNSVHNRRQPVLCATQEPPGM